MTEEKSTNKSNVQDFNTAREIIEGMPTVFNAEAAEGVNTTYQWDVTGDEEFAAHIQISDKQCTYHDGPAENPGIVIKTPADVWIKISKGELDGQQAYMTGQYSSQGDLMLLLKLVDLFPAG
ncbi:MAG: SCP2 sterol-binding domain-containing protein [Deltaproteobacteria bacterium]|nr:SCP2 sterol-binding domain-containing protein [Deltaproteobacteria bacterium]